MLILDALNFITELPDGEDSGNGNNAGKKPADVVDEGDKPIDSRKLPKTATNIYNGLFIRFTLLVIGSTIILVRIKKQNKVNAK